MVFTKYKSAIMVVLIVFSSLVLTSCQKTKDETSQEITEKVSVYKQDELPNELQELIDQDDAKAQTNLGVMYESGIGFRQDYAKAFEWFDKAANQGLVQAEFNLGVMYANGTGVRQDDTKAIVLFQNACDKGLQEGCHAYQLLN